MEIWSCSHTFGARALMSEQTSKNDEGKLLNAVKKKIKTDNRERGSKCELVKTDSKVKK